MKRSSLPLTRRSLILVAVLFFVIQTFAALCGAETGEVMNAAVSIPPQSYFVERLCRDRVKVLVMVRPGESPATYEPTPKQMAKLGRTRVYFRIGVPFENVFLPKLKRNYPDLLIVDTRRGIKLRAMAGGGEDRHEHGRAGLDPHIWMSPRLVGIQAVTICGELKRLDPNHANEFEANLKAFQADLNAMDARITRVLAPLKGRTLFVFHPAYGYFAEAYGLKQKAIELEGKEPGPKSLIRIINQAKQEGGRVIFVQPQFSRQSAKTIAEAIGGAVIPLDPLAKDYLKNLGEMADRIAAALK
ncbi:MAG: zinc ABC transporter substrate-binding protein [Thermodesulfobacteriota bacterium]|nr:zinc ABC transporter substrate-binding protein [Thermodesulfobacteriota bacterium]